ncbi:MAG: glycosyl hydrolase family 18 protein [Bacteroides sp.]|nr:glycosyl hydrolase family 18 protein [Bacteroides sp.]
MFGYLQSQQLPEYKVPWDKLTHLSIAFGRVSTEGALLADALKPLVPIYKEGQKKGVKVLMSVGGGSSKTMSDVLQNDAYRKRLKDELIAAVKEMDLDGLDIDYEEWTGGPGGTAGEVDEKKAIALEIFYKELREALPEGKLLTAATSAGYPEWNNGWGNYNVFRNSMFQYLDLVNVMVYDFTGKWKSSLIDQHVSMEHFVNAAKQWEVVRQVPKEKIILGVPFYGVLFPSRESPVGATHVYYKDILVQYPDQQPTEKDQIDLLYYNGRPTIKAKSEFVKDNGYGGIMIWAISHDSPKKEESLLEVINEVFSE